MKLISLAFDTDHSGKKMPPPIATFGYLFHPGTVIFGPWVSYAAYINSVENQKAVSFFKFDSLFVFYTVFYIQDLKKKQKQMKHDY